MAERDFKGVWIPKEIWLAEDIGWSAKMLLVEIDSLAVNNECFATNEYLAQFFGLSKDRISKLIRELRDKDYIEIELVYKAGTKQIDKRLISTRGYRRKCLGGIGENNDTPPGENNEDINTRKINTRINTKREKGSASLPETDNLFGSELQSAFDDWLRYKTERKDSYTPTGLNNLISEIRNNAAKHGDGAVVALIRKCIASGWKGIIFEKLEEQPRGRREPIPSWMSREERQAEIARKQKEAYDAEVMKYVDQMHRPKTVADDPEVAARAEALRERLTK